MLWRQIKRRRISAKLEAQIQRKEERKKKILEFLEKKKKISNEHARKHLGVARRTATKYCEELEKEGKIKQVGKTGRSVFYEVV
ncbi:MAG: winged helix-turn-helix transcriptional regulator [Patescibacteria group bacterium]|nr:winged helix-turn-helix transcriptional regulator [Patescibacteria group bacterium]